MINWKTHPTEIGCLAGKIKSNGQLYDLTIGHTFVKIVSTNSKIEVDALSLEDAKNKALKLVTYICLLK